MFDEQQERWHHYVGEGGVPEAVNLTTGEIAKRDVTLEQLKDHHQVQVGKQMYWVPITELVEITPEITLRFSPFLADTICRSIIEGKTLPKAALKAGITYYDLCKFRDYYPEFDTMVHNAKKKRAEFQFETLQEIAEAATESKEEIALGRLKVDVYKHLSAVGSDEFNHRSKVDVDTTVGVKIVDTGIRRTRELSNEEAELFERIAASQTKLIQNKGDK